LSAAPDPKVVIPESSVAPDSKVVIPESSVALGPKAVIPESSVALGPKAVIPESSAARDPESSPLYQMDSGIRRNDGGLNSRFLGKQNFQPTNRVKD